MTGNSFQSGQFIVHNLTGAELVAIDTGGAEVASTTAQDIANLAGEATQEVNTAIATVGAGVLTAAGIVGRLITRTGSVAAYTDTTDTAAAIIGAIPNAFVGQSFEVQIKNGVNFVQTIAAGVGVTPSGLTTIPGINVSTYLITITGAAALTMAHVKTTSISGSLPAVAWSTAALAAGTLAAGAITGANQTILTNTGATPGAQTVRTAAQMFADIPGAFVGMVTSFRIVNTGAGTFTLTADGGATVTINGTATIATNIWRDYTLTFNTAATATIQSVGSGVSP